jgi:hypothetical protein
MRRVVALLRLARLAHHQRAWEFHRAGRADLAQQHEAFVAEINDLILTVTRRT